MRIGWRLWTLIGAQLLNTAMVVGQITVLGKQVFDMTGSKLDLGLLGLSEFIPAMLLAPVSGMACDRYDRRKVMAIGLCGEMAVSAGLFFYIAASPTSATPIFALAMLHAVARAFVETAVRPLPVDLAPKDAVERVVAVNAAFWQAGMVVGPLVFTFAFIRGAALPYLLAAGVSLACILLVALTPRSRVRRAAAAPSWLAAVKNAFEGVRCIRANRILLGVTSLDLFAVLFGGAVALLPAIAEERLGVEAVGLGVLRAAAGGGAMLVASVLAVRPLRSRIGSILLLAVGVFGAATVVLGLTEDFKVAVTALAVLSGADAISVYIRRIVVPLATPEAKRGRVAAVESVFIGASNELGAFESGVAGHLLGVAGAVITGGLGTIAVVALWWHLFPELRQINRFSEVHPDILHE